MKKSTHLNTPRPGTNRSFQTTSIDSRMELVKRCIRLMRDLVPTLLTDYMFPVANIMREECCLIQLPVEETQRKRKKSLLQPPPKRLTGNARQEAFLLILFLTRMDYQCLERVGLHFFTNQEYSVFFSD